jgi:hypothetical protein
MTEQDKELAKQAWVENDWDGYLSVPKLIALIRADEREKVIAEFVEAGVLGYDGAVVQKIRARENI